MKVIGHAGTHYDRRYIVELHQRELAVIIGRSQYDGGLVEVGTDASVSTRFNHYNRIVEAAAKLAEHGKNLAALASLLEGVAAAASDTIQQPEDHA